MTLNRIFLITLTVCISTLASSCSGRNNEHYNRDKLIGYENEPFSVSVRNDTLVMRYLWDTEIEEYTIRIDGNTGNDIYTFESFIDTLPSLHPGVTLVLTSREIRKDLWRGGFNVVFLYDDTAKAVYVWKYSDGFIENILYYFDQVEGK